MDVLVFTSPDNPSKERFFHEVSKVPRLSPTFVLEPERFVALLKKKTIDWRVIVFFVYDQADLDLGLSLRRYVTDTRVIMVLSDWNDETVRTGLSVSPCLMTHASSDFSDVISVLGKISTLAH
jgi:hypothetical protein